VSQLLETGGIHLDVEGDEKSAVLAAIVKRLPLSPEVDRDFLLSVLDAREAMGSTGIGDGIAIPHVRNPILLHVDQPFITLCLLRRPVEFGAIDGKPVHAVFLVVSPSVPSHLRVLAQLAFVLRDPGLRQLLQDRAPPPAILRRVREIEKRTTGSFSAGKADQS
jgi:PTS system nitrogen regulatory IIA component